jgi:hypothetical protein
MTVGSIPACAAHQAMHGDPSKFSFGQAQWDPRRDVFKLGPSTIPAAARPAKPNDFPCGYDERDAKV